MIPDTLLSFCERREILMAPYVMAANASPSCLHRLFSVGEIYP